MRALTDGIVTLRSRKWSERDVLTKTAGRSVGREVGSS